MIQNELYKEDVSRVAALPLPWEKFCDSNIVITGGSGLLGTFFVDVLMEKNAEGLNCVVYPIGRNTEKARRIFSEYWADTHFKFISHDINKPIEEGEIPIDKASYILHLASNTHPVAYSTDPIGTITTNIIGLMNMLNFASDHHADRFAFASSNEIYGENRGDVELFDEQYCGYINSNTMRAGYPESKRCGEALCQAYIKQKSLDVVIPRFTRSYGPTMLKTDTKAISQFIKKGIAGEDIVLKSKGTQYYSYTYMADAISGLLTILLKGECGEAYNIADEASDIMLKDLAAIIASYKGKKVVFELPDDIEKDGYSTATKARLNGNKLKMLGWNPQYDIETGIYRTMTIFQEM